MTALPSSVRCPPDSAALRLSIDQAFNRVAGAPLSAGNRVDLLIDGAANFEAWLASIRAAKVSILFENYIFDDDEISHEFRRALTERAEAGVQVSVIRDWLGCLGTSGNRFWRSLRAAGGEVRTYNPLNFISPLGWLARDHRKSLVVDSEVGFISGVCVSKRWLGNSARGIAPWRDTGVAVRGPAVQALALAFAENWARLGTHLPASLPILNELPPVVGQTNLRVVATLPSTTGLFRLDQLIAAIAERSLWLTDAYFVGIAPYVQALCSAAHDGVDVRLLVPGTSDVPIVGRLSRASYRPLLEAGVRVYEWNGSMLHAKTAVVDGRWSRVGSSNLNLASWMDNCELDIAIEDNDFAAQMQAQYERDLREATEIVLLSQRPPRRAGPLPRGGSSGRAAAGALRVANTVGAAIANRRVFESSEGGILIAGALVSTGFAAIALLWPRALAWPLAGLAAWIATALVAKYAAVHRRARAARVPQKRPG
jgi:cardiolipin synthase